MRPAQPLQAGQLAKACGISPLLAQCLLNRGISESNSALEYLEPRLKNLADPFLLPGMLAAVERLFQAREKGESLVIFGDYDVDGVTSVALLVETLRPLGWKLDYYLPSRMEEGYGLSAEAIENCLRKYPTTLLLAVDCGSSSFTTIETLRDQGIDVIVLDHHQVSIPTPKATALINPQLSVGTGEKIIKFSELCSVGLAFKLAHAVVKRGRGMGLPAETAFDLRPLLDLVALGTIADLVPLTGENRILVSVGLERLNRTTRPGLVALKRIAQSESSAGTYEVGFQLAPRLNAAGRMETAEAALDLLLCKSPESALRLAQELDACNRDRQKIEREIAEEAIATLKSKFKSETDFVIVEGQPLWHVGVVGIVASRVVQQFYRPTIIVGGDGGEFRGSGRSVAGFDLASALRECGDLLIRHGGHAMAAGITIASANLELFRTRLNEIARRALKLEELNPPLRIDAEVGLDEVTLACLKMLDRLKPNGQGNPGVNLLARNLTHARPVQRIGQEKQHVKMWVTDGMATGEAVWWGAGMESLPVGKFDLVFTPQTNDYNGQRRIQLKVLDWRAAVKDGDSGSAFALGV